MRDNGDFYFHVTREELLQGASILPFSIHRLSKFLSSMIAEYFHPISSYFVLSTNRPKVQIRETRLSKCLDAIVIQSLRVQDLRAEILTVDFDIYRTNKRRSSSAQAQP